MKSKERTGSLEWEDYNEINVMKGLEWMEWKDWNKWNERTEINGIKFYILKDSI